MSNRSLTYESWKRLKKNKLALVCGACIAALCTIALFAEQISPYPFDEQHIDDILAPFSSKYWLGTDGLGRDLFSRLIYGSRISLAVGIIASLISSVLGLIYGTIAGWCGGRIDAFMMRTIDVLYAIPGLVLIILVKIFFEATLDIENPELRAFVAILAALSMHGWLSLGRVVRGQVLQVKESLFVESAHALGANGFQIIMKQILPNILGPVIIMLTIQIPGSIVAESALSFLGLGLQPPFSSWGILANEGWKALRVYPHLMISPSVVLFITVLAFNLLGDGLRDALDVKSK